jgi:hypothetical protein
MQMGCGVFLHDELEFVARRLAAKWLGGFGGGAFFSVFLKGHTFQDINSLPDIGLAGAYVKGMGFAIWLLNMVMGKAIKSDKDMGRQEDGSKGQPVIHTAPPSPAKEAFMHPGPEDTSAAKDEQEGNQPREKPGKG